MRGSLQPAKFIESGGAFVGSSQARQRRAKRVPGGSVRGIERQRGLCPLRGLDVIAQAQPDLGAAGAGFRVHGVQQERRGELGGGFLVAAELQVDLPQLAVRVAVVRICEHPLSIGPERAVQIGVAGVEDAERVGYR